MPPAGTAGTPPTAMQGPRKGMSSCAIVLIVVAVLGVPTLGVLAALGIYGFRRYLAASKVAEAKNTVGAISRAAVAAYERERPVRSGAEAEGQAGHQLCGSAIPVPAAVPAGLKYQPNPIAGHDYETGDDNGGWRCLRFGLTAPHYYQYHYYRDGSIVASASPFACRSNCFEAAAVGDLDGDGVVSRFARTGQIDTSGTLTASTQLYIENEFE